MDASRDIMESAKPPKPPRPGTSGRSPEEVDGARSVNPLLWTITACAVAAAVFTGITAWETHQDRANTELIYCSFYSGDQLQQEGEERTLTDYEKRLVDQLGCD
ncbi:hypothetical protein [Nocardioides baculatus]|jgi:hypothetical protein|uniref:Uncharacterized protein n=1 Tax=Nocardioides baculatus TaxID=2801337 RepID=A0ABS1LD00_9ACTN|nr:hypothetical protein [Nocardioides baculatus]MBL0749417.1 hypothetical protein [Nocardioides baculatus]